MRRTQLKAAVVALAAVGLLSAGTVAYADGDVTGVAGGQGGKAVSGGNTSNSNGAVSGTADSSGGKAGSADNYQSGAAPTPHCGGTSRGGATWFLGLVGVGDVNACPNVGPVASSMKGGDANGGTSSSGSVEQDNNSSSAASADGGAASNGTKSNPKKHRRRHR